MSILHERVHLDTTDHDDSRVPFTHFKVIHSPAAEVRYFSTRLARPFRARPRVDERHRAPRKRMRADEGV